MTNATPPDFKIIQPLRREPAFELSAPPSASGIMVSPQNVTQSDGTVLLTWEDAFQNDTIPLTDQVLDGFVITARKVAQRFPNNVRATTNLAIALMKRGDVCEATALLQTALAIDPSDEIAAVTLADTLAKEGQLEEAEAILDRLTRSRTDNVRARLALAHIALRRSGYSEAKEHLRVALTESRDSARVHFMLGIVELNAGNLAEAVGALRRATHVDVKNPLYHYCLGVAYAVQHNYGRAEVAFTAALTVSPRSIKTIHALAHVLLDGGKAEKAIELLRPHTEVKGADVEARELLARAYAAAGRHQMARSIVKGILQEHGSALPVDRRVVLLNAIAVSYMADHKPEEAEIALRRAIEIGPRVSSMPYENLGRVYIYYLERPGDAIVPLRKAQQLFPEAQMTRVLLAIVLTSYGDTASALNQLLPLLNQGVTGESVYVCLGWLYGRIGTPSLAISVLTEGLTRFPGGLALINNLGYTYLTIGDVENAQRVLNNLPKGATPHTELVATFGLLKLWEGKEEQGRELYEQAESMATSQGHRQIAKRARQKKHLELARMYVRNGKSAAAVAELRKGLIGSDFPLSYREEIESLRQRLEATLQGNGAND